MFFFKKLFIYFCYVEAHIIEEEQVRRHQEKHINKTKRHLIKLFIL